MAVLFRWTDDSGRIASSEMEEVAIMNTAKKKAANVIELTGAPGKDQ